MYGHMCHMCICRDISIYIYAIYVYIFIRVMLSYTLSLVPTSTFLGVNSVLPLASLDLLSIETPDSGDSWATWRSLMWSATSFSCKQGKYGISKHKATEKSRQIKCDCETVTASRNKEVVCMHIGMPCAGVLQFCIAKYKLKNMLQQKDRKCWPHCIHGPYGIPPMPKGHLKRFQQPSRTPGIPHCTAWGSILITVLAYTVVKLYCVFGWSSCSITSSSPGILIVETHVNTVIAEWWLALIMGKETVVSITMDSILTLLGTHLLEPLVQNSWMHENWMWNGKKKVSTAWQKSVLFWP